MFDILLSVLNGTIRYKYVAIKHDRRTIAHVFVAPQDMKGLDIGYIVPVREENRLTIGGDISVGNPQDGTYDIPFNITYQNDEEGELLLGEEEFDLQKGRTFAIKEGYTIIQLPFQSKSLARIMLATIKRS